MLTALLCGCHTEEVKWLNATQVQLQQVNGMAYANGDPFSGVVYQLSENGIDTFSVVSFRNGKEHGVWRRYYAGGQLMEQRYFEEGKKAGVYEGWWPNGKQRLLYHFVNGEYEGTCKDWTENGQLLRDMNYHKGYESGLQKQYYENGKPKANYLMKDGHRYGLLGTKNCVNVSDSVFQKN